MRIDGSDQFVRFTATLSEAAQIISVRHYFFEPIPVSTDEALREKDAGGERERNLKMRRE